MSQSSREQSVEEQSVEEQSVEEHEECRVKHDIYAKQCEKEGSHHKLIWDLS